MSLSTLRRPLALVTLPVALALVGAPGCGGGDPDYEVDPPTASPMSNPPPSGSTGCSGVQWVGLKTTSAACPSVPNWTEELLFSAPQPPALQHHCMYRWSNPTSLPTAVDIATFQSSLASAGVVSLAEDCMIVGGLGEDTSINEVVRPKLRDALLSSAGGVSALPTSRSRSRSMIRLAVVDSAPKSDGDDPPHGSSDHGYSMGWLAKSLSCPLGPLDPSCKTFVTTHLGLPLLKPEHADTINGGYFGGAADLVKGIRDAVKSWYSQAQTGQARLIINLSVGWQPGFADCTVYNGPSFPPPTQDLPKESVFSALIEASCHGALIIAATGNHPGAGAFDPGPTCPAAWEAVRAPTQQECNTLFGNSSYNDGLPAGAPAFPPANMGPFPLVYGVGGLSHTGAPLTITRPASLSRLVAPAFGGAAGRPGEVPASPLTGSSVAAALTSGTAAAIWSYAPELSAHEVMAHVMSSGAVVEVPAALRNPAFMNPPAPVRRLSLCAALQSICGVAECGAPTCAPTQPFVLDGETSALIDKFYGDAAVVNAILEEKPVAASDEFQDVAVPPWNHPLPVEPTCGGPCGYKPGAQKLEISINPALQGGSLTNAALVLYNSSGERRVLKPLGQLALQPGAKMVFTGMTPPPGFVPVHATLVFQGLNLNGDKAAVTEHILIR